MENVQNNTDNKKTVLITVVAGVLVLGALVWWMKEAQAPQQVGVSPTPTPDVEAAAINQGIDSINVGDLNTEFDAIDKDLQGL
ncbi:MAG: hypothetical protein AAB857_04200 [Patescibacteria group bacterium]